MYARSVAVVSMAILVAAIAVGCGGSGSGGSTGPEGQSGDSSDAATSSPDKATFVKEAGAACQRAREDALERIGAYEKAHRSEGLSKAELSENAFKAVLLSTIEEEIAALRRLGAPAGEEEEIEAILAELQVDVGKGKEAKQGTTVSDVEEFFNNADKKLQEAGLAECTKNG